jgi:hypothetical protein
MVSTCLVGAGTRQRLNWNIKKIVLARISTITIIPCTLTKGKRLVFRVIRLFPLRVMTILLEDDWIAKGGHYEYK